MPYRPTTENVAVAWLKGISYVGNSASTNLPPESSTWSTPYFVTVNAVGGSPSIYYATANSVVQVDCWGSHPNTGKPAWGEAEVLAEKIRMATLDHSTVGRLLTFTSGSYNNARVLNAYLLTEPRKIRADKALYARYTFDLALSWIEVV